ncbi:ACT domain-containing protein [Amphibacillus cookii]|uniref:ACT domain-containing protein n=1 Tax=Amphibacillus cookii TaxID=767787 RepID=UPI001957D4BA|nr:ACT domain-containing protein [Amphibacillus cookii]MBM7542089.1 ACT domain-containing protein [Amphibacillus cookii]
MQKRAVVTVVGKDQVGIIARVTNVLADHNMNIHDISQTILQDYFTMMMIVEMADKNRLDDLLEAFEAVEKDMNLTISIQLEDVFQAMHRI